MAMHVHDVDRGTKPKQWSVISHIFSPATAWLMRRDHHTKYQDQHVPLFFSPMLSQNAIDRTKVKQLWRIWRVRVRVHHIRAVVVSTFVHPKPLNTGLWVNKSGNNFGQKSCDVYAFMSTWQHGASIHSNSNVRCCSPKALKTSLWMNTRDTTLARNVVKCVLMKLHVSIEYHIGAIAISTCVDPEPLNTGLWVSKWKQFWLKELRCICLCVYMSA